MLRMFVPIALLLCLSLPTYAQDKNDTPQITVSGQGEIRVAPDEVVFSLQVSKRDKDLGKAKALNDESVKGVLAIAEGYNIPTKNVQTSSIEVEPVYGEQEGRKGRVFWGYSVKKISKSL